MLGAEWMNKRPKGYWTDFGPLPPRTLSYVHLIATGAIIKVYFRQVKWERAKCRTFKALARVKG